jgi:metallophosphoesterase (TIGR00282 family)
LSKQGVRILFLGDVVGALGCAMVQKHLPRLRKELDLDGVVVNGENSCEGKGITQRLMRFFKHQGVDVVTSGNHIWAKREVYQYLTEHEDLLRPANFPDACPGTGVTQFTTKSGHEIAIINVQGRVFMHQHTDCPFRKVEALLPLVKTKMVFVDFHAEATSEKIGLGLYLDGKVSGVVGTHTHVQTADERILPNGTAFITDLGMAGARFSMIGMKPEPVLSMFLTQMPHKFEVQETGPAILSGAWIEVDPETGRALTIERVQVIDEEISIHAGG